MRKTIITTMLAVVGFLALNTATARADGSIPEPKCPPGQQCN